MTVINVTKLVAIKFDIKFHKVCHVVLMARSLIGYHFG